MKKILLIFLVLAILICAGVIFFYIIKKQKGIEHLNGSQYYSVEIARKAAQDNLSSFENWKGAQIDETYIMYDTKNTPSAYLFTVKDYYGKAGYLVIGATNKITPLIESSNMQKNPYVNLVNLASQVADQTRHNPSDLRSQLIYLGGKNYLARFEIREGPEVEIRYYVLSDNINLLLDETGINERVNFYNSLQQPDSDNAWEKYLR